MANEKVMTYEKVKYAIDMLSQKGIKATNKNIIKELGYGSNQTLCKLRQLYPSLMPNFKRRPERRPSTADCSHESIHEEIQELKEMIQELTNRYEALEKKLPA